MRKKILGKKVLYSIGIMIGILMGANQTMANAPLGWTKVGENWKYYTSNQTLQKGWAKIGEDWYFFSPEGNMKTGWLKTPEGEWYFLDSTRNGNEGKLLKGWQWIDGYCYYFEVNQDVTLGKMRAGTNSPDNFLLNAQGQWVDTNGKAYYIAEKGISTKENISVETGRKIEGAKNGSSRSSGGGGGSSRSSGGGSSHSLVINQVETLESINLPKNITTSENVTVPNSTETVAERTEISEARNISQEIVPEQSQAPENENTSQEIVPEQSQAPENENTSQEIVPEQSQAPENENTSQEIVPEQSQAPENENTSQEIVPEQSQAPENENTSQEIVPEQSQAPENENTSQEIVPEQTQPPRNANTLSRNRNNRIQRDTPRREESESPQDKAERIKNTLSAGKNKNVAQYIDEDTGEIKIILWVDGITPPQMGAGGDFRKESIGGYETYKCEYKPGNGWYDVNKTRRDESTGADETLCFAATASNMLHWWMEQNKDEIQAFIKQQEQDGKLNEAHRGTVRDIRSFVNSFEDPFNSNIFKMFIIYFRGYEKGFVTDLLADMYINGYKPKELGGTNSENFGDFHKDERAGFFHEVFGRKILTDRTSATRYNYLSEMLKKKLSNGDSLALAHNTFNKQSDHVITVWGAEYDINGKLTGIYITDSDDQDERGAGMKRFDVNNVSGEAKITTNRTNKNSGSKVTWLYSLSTGKEYWN